MLKRMNNHAVVELEITPADPLLIKSGQATVSGVDMSFVKTYKHGTEAEPFIPGSSLKGMIRSYSEKICRSLRATPVPVCLPYLEPGRETKGEEDQAACGLRIKNHLKATGHDAIPTQDAYKLSCPACRMFGSHYFAGRLATSDGYLTEIFRSSSKPVLETRDGVAIDRLTGGPAGSAKYDLEVLTRAEFFTRVEILNFERWQLGLLGLVLRDMEDGLIRLGMGKSRGLGRIAATISRFELSYYGSAPEQLTGLAEACTDEERRSYGLCRENAPARPLPAPRSNGLRYVYDITETWKEDLEPAVMDLASYVSQVPWPRDIVRYTEGRG